ncbi:Neur-chan-LBD domain-containing protein [Aphelenchoides fujianensis]|nr:Neur-chan-LBD domain-containing protein [Aphelenchoides fujianensis]
MQNADIYLLSFAVPPLSFHSTRSQRIRAVQAPSARNQLLSKLLKGYDKEKSSTVPVLVYTSMIIEHLREFNEYDMTLHMQSVFIMNWRDERLVWEPKDYGNLTKIPIDDYKVQRMPLQRPIIQPLNTELLILSDGYVYSISQISTPTTCRNNLALYPYDTPHCSLYIVNRNRDDKLVFGNRQMFNLRNSFVIGNNVTLNPGYEIFNFTLQRYYLTSDGLPSAEQPKNQTTWTGRRRTARSRANRWSRLGSLIEYQFFFRRNTSTYLSSVLLPLYLCTLVLLLGACIEDLRRSLIVLVFGCFLLFTTVFRISLGLPPNYPWTLPSA